MNTALHFFRRYMSVPFRTGYFFVYKEVKTIEMMLSKQAFKEVAKLIKGNCCNCYKDNCLLLDDGDTHTCPQLITPSHIICKYFLKAVLPGEKALFRNLSGQEATERITCKGCGKKTERTGRNQKYCPDCARENQRKRNAEFMASKRSRRGYL